MADQTEAEAVETLAQLAYTPKELKAGAVLGIALPSDQSFEVRDLEQYLERPRRKRGTITLHDADSLAYYVGHHHEVGRTGLYADVTRSRIVAELNGHLEDGSDAGWGDHRAVLTLRHTPNWQLWSGHNERWMSQTDFAEHVEAGLPDIVEPAAADMLEVAQTFQANSRVAFRSSTLLSSGQRQLSYEETIDSKAGQQGNMTMPTEMFIGVAVYEGQTQGHRVKARLQHRIERDSLKLRYLLDRPHDVVKAAFDDVVSSIETATSLKAYRGIPADD